MLARFSLLFGALIALSAWWAWRPPLAMVDLTVSHPGGVTIRGAEVTWIAKESLMGRAGR